MSYLVLARKSRPQSFKEVVGQKPIVKTLQNALANNRVAHALIFSGVRGTGKTTLARIMAKAINCENGPGREPCNACTSCRQITEGNSVDLHEIDGASNRGIQEIRELKEKIRFMPTSSRYKIIIIDEVHMLTTEAFNALLKTLEEPPSHIFFMFATTELHKVPVTILSRCQRFELKRIDRHELKQHFRYLAETENISMDDGALDIVAREAGGSVRDGLSLLDQIFAYCGDVVTAEDVVEVLGVAHHSLVADLVEALLEQDLRTVYSKVSEIYNHGLDLKRLSGDLLSWFRNLILCSVHKGDTGLLDLPDDDLKRLQEVAGQQDISQLTSVFNLLLTGFEKIQFSSYPKLTLELTFLRVIQAGKVVEVSHLIRQFNALIGEEQLPLPSLKEVGIAPPAASAVSEMPRSTNHPAAISPNQALEIKANSPLLQEREKGSFSVDKQNDTQKQQQESEPVESNGKQKPGKGEVESESIDQPENSQTVTNPTRKEKDIRKNWLPFVSYVQERARWMGAALQHASSVKKVEGELVIQFEDAADCTLLKNKEHIRRLSEYVLDFFQQELTVRFKVPDGVGCEIDGQNAILAREERKALANDPLVLTAVDIFNGQVGDVRIGPRYRQSQAAVHMEQEEKIEHDEIN
ncbi:DNA polymerase III subunit gamma/tau [Desulfogranum japonicum]|uniref:DNA polymerase III subunit gamma/tau n=1 Tax=Desulfogranum japonicum TaxID=231447 RepID=UPI0004061055|nr:DNA polymerase III subunit gamma/tau [Desulfogranum japonicum]